MVGVIASIALLWNNSILKILLVIVFGSLYTAIVYKAGKKDGEYLGYILAFTFPMIVFWGVTAIFSEIEGTNDKELPFLQVWSMSAGFFTILYAVLNLLQPMH